MASPAKSSSSNIFNFDSGFNRDKDIEESEVEQLAREVDTLKSNIAFLKEQHAVDLETIRQLNGALEEADKREASMNATMRDERNMFTRLKDRVTLATGLSGAALTAAVVLLVVAIVVLAV